MGKSLSTLAITTQVYNINGWSIWPPHLALGDDVELPISMEHLRPYLRKRKGPIRAPPGLRHNQRYHPKSIQSRQLLTDSNQEQMFPDTYNDKALSLGILCQFIAATSILSIIRHIAWFQNSNKYFTASIQ